MHKSRNDVFGGAENLKQEDESYHGGAPRRVLDALVDGGRRENVQKIPSYLLVSQDP